MSVIMQAKLDLPAVNDIFARERLGEALALALAARVFIVQAGPGSGKTALLASVIRDRGLPCVWLQVDQADADPHRLARYLLAGLARVGGGVGAVDGGGCNGGGEALVTPPAAVAHDQETLLARLLAAIEDAVAAAAVRPLVLVFDDFDQATGEATPGLVTRLADYLPAGATIWLACRKTPNLPLRRWQAVRLAAGLDQTDLALTPAEVAGFCRAVLGIELDEAAADIIYRACSGWIGGLILLSAALRERTQAALVDAAQRLLRQLSPREVADRSSRRPTPGAEAPLDEGVANPLHPLVEYVSSEVISRQPPELQRLVTYAAVLPFVTAGAAAELTGEPLAAVVGLMNKAADLVPLVIRLEHGRLAYHPMLRASLLERLVQLEGSLRLAQLRAVAGGYLAANGWPEEALDCYIQGGHFERAVAVLDGEVLPLALHGRTATVGAWLDRLPWDLVAGRPALLAALGVVRQAAGRLEEALVYWRQALELIVAGGPDRAGGDVGSNVAPEVVPEVAPGADAGDPGQAVAATCRALIATVLAERGQAGEGRTVLGPALALPEGRLAAGYRARLLDAMAFCQWMSDEWDQAWQTAQDAATWYSRAGDPFGEAAVLNVLGVMFHEPRGQYERTLACMGQAIELVEPHGVSPQLLLYKANYGHILTELGRTDEAVEILVQTVKAGERLGVGKALMLARMFLAQAYLDLARFTDCRVEFERALAMAREMGDKLRIGGVYYGMANMHRDRGELDLALDLAGRDLALMREIGNAHYLLQSLLNVGFVHLHRGEPDVARRVLAEAERCAAGRPLGLEGVRLYFGLAAAVLLDDEPRAYPAYLERGLAYCEGRDCTIVFVRDRRVIEPVLRLGVADGIRVTACQNLLGALGDMADDLAGSPVGMPSDGGAMGEPVSVLSGPVRLPDDRGLVVSCLGRFMVQLDGVEVPVSAWHKTKALRLFKLLLANRVRWVPVEQIVEVLWPEMRLTPALANFRVTLHHARRVLAAAGATHPRGLLLYEQRRCRINPDELTWVDADQFAERIVEAKGLAAAGQAAAAAAAYLGADNLYGGDFLPDDVYEDWAARPRENLRAMAVAGLEWLAGYRLDLGRSGAAVVHLSRALGLDPYREDLHRELMSALAADGRVAEAIAAYRRCEQLLVQELSVAPAQETVDLYRRLLQSNQPAG